MANLDHQRDELLSSLPLPLPALGIAYTTTAHTLSKLAESALETQRSWGIDCKSNAIATDFSVAKIGSIEITAGRTKPVALEYRISERITVELCHAGHSRFREGITDLQTSSGEILSFPNRGGILCGGHHSGISFCLDRERLKRTAKIILQKDPSTHLENPYIIDRSTGANLLFALFEYVNLVLKEGPEITESLTIDDQIYRSYVYSFAKSLAGGTPNILSQKKWNRSKDLDPVIDYIKANLDQPISLTDLEEQSHYSARHLQNLFQDRFGCSPMRFVRRQRLSSAMERLKTAAWGDSVTSIARGCGYRFSSNFSTDFLHEYGVNPSSVIRACRGSGTRRQRE